MVKINHRISVMGVQETLVGSWNKLKHSIDQFRYIKIQPKTKDHSTRLWGINTEFVGFIPQSLVLRSIVLDWILIYRNWSINVYCNRPYLTLSCLSPSYNWFQQERMMVSWFRPVCKVSCFSFLFLKVTSTASQSVVERWKKANARNAAQESVAMTIGCELIISLRVKWMALDTLPSPIWLTSITLTGASFSFNLVI